MTITTSQYFAGVPDYAPTDEELRRAQDLLKRVNALLDAYPGKVRVNPHTQCRISGTRAGGFRARDSAVGAGKSQHKEARAIDIYDPYRELAEWCWTNLEAMQACGLWGERPEWTPSWVHLQTVPPGSGMRWFVPSSSPALAPKLKAQEEK